MAINLVEAISKVKKEIPILTDSLLKEFYNVTAIEMSKRGLFAKR